MTAGRALVSTAETVEQGEVAWSPEDIVDEWGLQSFPASDAPANW